MAEHDHSASDSDGPVNDVQQKTAGGYSQGELRSNRTTIGLFTIGFIVCSWVFSPPSGAVVLTAIALLVAGIFWRLFASQSASRLDDDSVGMGKDVGPVTMGTILGYLYNGFKR